MIERLRERVATLEKLRAEVRVPQKPSIRQRTRQGHAVGIELCIMKLLASRVVSAEEIPEILASVSSARSERASDMELPSERFIRAVRSGVGIIRETAVTLALGYGDVVDAATARHQGDRDHPGSETENLTLSAYEISDQSVARIVSQFGDLLN